MGLLDRMRRAFGGSGVKKPAAPVPVVSLRPRELKVTAGLDFGTCTTKCILNLEDYDGGRGRRLAVVFPATGPAPGTLCLPTTVGVTDDGFIFGEAAEALPQGQVIRSIKMAIPCMAGGWGSYHSPFISVEKPGCFRVREHEFSAVELSSLYLGVILRQVWTVLSRRLGPQKAFAGYLNMAAPLDHLAHYYQAAERASLADARRLVVDSARRDTELSARYAELAQWSLKLCKIARQSWPFLDARKALDEVRRGGTLPIEKSPAYVVPETQAAITEFINRPDTRPGHFMTFDVGAGSTDVSVFWLERHGAVIKPWYYASASLHAGMDDIDRRLEVVTRPLRGASVRAGREALQVSERGLARHRAHFQDVLDQIAKHRRLTFGAAYKLAKKTRVWNDLVLLLLGGGCQVQVIRDLGATKPWVNLPKCPRVESLDLRTTDLAVLPNGSEKRLSAIPSLDGQTVLLVVAEGLATRIIDIPPYGIRVRPLFTNPPPDPEEPFKWDSYMH